MHASLRTKQQQQQRQQQHQTLCCAARLHFSENGVVRKRVGGLWVKKEGQGRRYSSWHTLTQKWRKLVAKVRWKRVEVARIPL